MSGRVSFLLGFVVSSLLWQHGCSSGATTGKNGNSLRPSPPQDQRHLRKPSASNGLSKTDYLKEFRDFNQEPTPTPQSMTTPVPTKQHAPQMMTTPSPSKAATTAQPSPSPTTMPTVPCNQKVFSQTEDFVNGTLISLDTSTPNQLELDETPVAFRFVWIPASGNSQIVKVSADTGEILGRYEAGPASRGAGNPSRTTVAADGSVWFGNRGHDPGTVVHIGLVEAGQCEDRNGNG